MNKRDSQLLAPVARQRGVVQPSSAAAYLAASMPRGKRLERLIQSEATRPRPMVVLTVVKQAAAWIPDRVNGGATVQARKGPCDAFGTFVGSGRCLVFDAKECGRATSFDYKGTRIKPHQERELIRHGTAGAVAGFMVLNTTTGVIHWLNWDRIVRPEDSYPWDTLPVVGSACGISWPTVEEQGGSVAEGGAA